MFYKKTILKKYFMPSFKNKLIFNLSNQAKKLAFFSFFFFPEMSLIIARQ